MSERFVVQGESVIVDRDTGLMWQRVPSQDRMVWKEGFGYVETLNKESFGGYRDWRYPNKDEIATLILQVEDRGSGIYADPVFGPQRCFWTSSEVDHKHHRACYADFYYGDVYIVEENYANHFVRAVRNAA
jgi:serine/threonine-protein kinase